MKVIQFYSSRASGGIESIICNLSNVMVGRCIVVTIGTLFAPPPQKKERCLLTEVR